MKIPVIFSLFLLLSGALAAEEAQFVVEIEFDRESCEFTLHQGEESSSVEFVFDDVIVRDREIRVYGETLLDSEGFHFGTTLIPIEKISVDRVRTRRENYRVILRQKSTTTTRRRAASGDMIFAFESFSIPEEEFVRGDVLMVGDDLKVDGEVNGDVISLFGNISLSRTAICQRNVLAVGGSIDRHPDARVYGAFQATEEWRKWTSKRRRRYTRNENEIDLGASLSYNRVDGLGFMADITFRSEEKFMPEFFAYYGYGFWSDRSRYRLGFKQTLFNYHHLSFGGEVYRLTRTEDEWRCGAAENNIYAILAREDFRDYWEGEGGSLFLQQEIGYDHRFRVDYFFEELEFLPANPDQWSLFGGSKKFRANFSSVEQQYREDHLPDFTQDESVFSFTYEFNTSEDRHGELMRSGWVARLTADHSSETIGSDFDYDRVTLEVRRFQPLTYRQNVNLRLMVGSATGNVPLHRHFFLGGIRTLRAYDIKEYYGTRMVLANLEYVINFPSTELGIALLFDIGKTGWDSDFLSDPGWTGDVGAGIDFIGLRLELTRQFNGYTDDLQFSVLMGRSF